MPLVLVDRIVVDSSRAAKSRSIVCAPHKHNVAAAGCVERPYTRQEVDVVVSGATGAICGDEYLADQTFRVDRLAGKNVSAQAYSRYPIEGRGYRPISRITGTK